MSEAQVVSFNLKAVINKQKTGVLFVEVDNDFLDVLFSFLILPLGNIVHAMEKHYGDKAPHVIGSLNTLYNGLSSLQSFHFQEYSYKPAILSPKIAYLFPFLNKKRNFYRSGICDLGEAYFVVFRVFTEEKASFIISDDLRIAPNGNGSIVQTLNSVGIDMSDIDGAVTGYVTFGLNQIMDFLKGLLVSRQPLTDIILGGAAVKSESRLPLHQIKKEPTSNSPRKYVLKIMLQKSTKKVLFAQAGKDFASFLATMLTIPLGIVDLHLGGNTCLYKVHNLYRSIIDLLDHKYLNRTDSKDRLMKVETFTHTSLKCVVASLVNAMGSRMYMVMDDLTVTLLCVSSGLSLLSQMKISTSDVEEVDLHIGLEEARNILKASCIQ